VNSKISLGEGSKEVIEERAPPTSVTKTNPPTEALRTLAWSSLLLAKVRWVSNDYCEPCASLNFIDSPYFTGKCGENPC
jgi:hypothetical protein